MDLPWQAFGFTLHAQLSLGGLCLGFLSTLGLLYAEKLDLAISMPLSSGSASFAGLGVQVGATWAKSAFRSPKSCLEVPSQSGQDRQVGPVGSVLLSELWNRPEKSWDSSQARGQSLSKRQDI